MICEWCFTEVENSTNVSFDSLDLYINRPITLEWEVCKPCSHAFNRGRFAEVHGNWMIREGHRK